MIAPYYYIDAKRRLRESNITIDMMGGIDECSSMIVAQRDMLELEVEYYQKQSRKYTAVIVCLAVCILLYYIFRSQL